jgi:hypothetical protein
MFSTPFFSFAETGLEMSKEFWVYWVVVVPLTLAVLLIWWWWIGGSYRKIKARVLHTPESGNSALSVRRPVGSKTWG